MTASSYAELLLAAEVLAMSVCELFPEAQFAGSEVSLVDYACDFAIPQPIDEQIIPFIEEKFRSLVKQNLPVKVSEMMRENGAAYLGYRGHQLRADAASGDPSNVISIVEIGNFYDYLPLGEQVTLPAETGAIGSVKILNITFANSRVRFHGLACPNSYELKKLVKKRERFRERNHETLGVEMQLWSQLDCGFCWLPKGVFLINTLKAWWTKTVQQRQFQLLASPCIQTTMDASVDSPCFEWDAHLYTAASSKALAHAQVFSKFAPLAADLPIRFAEIGEFFNCEAASLSRGLLNSKVYHLDQLHLFCRRDQVDQELISFLQFFDKTIKIFCFEYQWCLIPSRGSRAVGTRSSWNRSVELLISALCECGIEYKEDSTRTEDDGPRAKMQIFDPLGCPWSGPSLVIDEALPAKLKLGCQGDSDQSQRPVMLRGSFFGSLERFTALLLEHSAGRLPFWLAPEHVRVLPLNGRHAANAEHVRQKLEQEGYRVGIDLRNIKLGGRVHAAECEKIPYVVILGDKEKEGLITLRSCFKGEKESRMSLDLFLEQLKEACASETGNQRGDVRKVESK